MTREAEDFWFTFVIVTVCGAFVAGLVWLCIWFSIMGCENSWSQPSQWHFTTDCTVLVDGEWVPADTVKVVPHVGA